MDQLITFFIQNIITIVMGAITLAVGYGYSKAKESQREIKMLELEAAIKLSVMESEDMKKRMAAMDTFVAVQIKENLTTERHFEKANRWMETLEMKVDRIFEKIVGGSK